MNTTPIQSKLFHSCSNVHMDRYIHDPNQLYQRAIEQNLRFWSRRDVAGALELVLQVRQLPDQYFRDLQRKLNQNI